MSRSRPSRRCFARRAIATATLVAAGFSPALRAQTYDEFHWLGEINKASAVMLVERQIVPRDVGRQIAAAVSGVLEAGNRPGADRPGDYLEFERLLIEAGGPAVTRVHSGRSRQDIKGTIRRLFMRDDLLLAFERLLAARDALLSAAAANRDAIVPAYTYGVQAQPTTVGHYLGAYAAALARTADRYRESWARVNRSALGSAALGTSSFPVDRPRLAELLGFDGNVENSFDANQLAPLDAGLDVTAAASSGALTIGTFAADLTMQYAQIKPWLTLRGGDVTGTSSIMPQKRNPTALVDLRQQASTVVGLAVTYAVQAHNVPSGMEDYKMGTPSQALEASAALYAALATLVNALVFDPARALDEVNAEYSTTTELADLLQRQADVPFRVGHHFASQLVNFGRSRNLRPAELPYADARRIYAEAAQHFDQRPAELPLAEREFRRALTPEHMIGAAQGLGGPQPSEVARMLAHERSRLDDDRRWLADRRERLTRADARREAAFAGVR